MRLAIEDFLTGSVGSISVLTDDRILFQGQIDRERYCNNNSSEELDVNVTIQNQFIVLVLTCDVAIIRDNGELKTICPTLYQDGDIVRINIANIVAIGPSRGCIEHHYEA